MYKAKRVPNIKLMVFLSAPIGPMCSPTRKIPTFFSLRNYAATYKRKHFERKTNKKSDENITGNRLYTPDYEFIM